MNDLRREEGASLIAVILFITVFGVITAAILDFASTGFRATETVADVRTQVHTVDGALDGAINAIRGSKKGLPSEGACPTFTLAANGKQPAVTVECTPVGNPTGGIFDNQPAWALLTLGNTASDPGLSKDGNFQTTIDGGVFSNTKITATGGSDCKKDDLTENCNRLNVVGDALALGVCNPIDRLKATGQVACSPTPVDASRGTDPGYPTARTESQVKALPVDPVSASQIKCLSGGTVVKFVPGIYSEPLASLVQRAITEGVISSSCASAATWWLSPTPDAGACPSTMPANTVGVYYFNFENSPSWTLAQTLVAGSLKAGCASGGAPAGPITFPDACDDAQPGVQLIFGGKTRLTAPGGGQRLAVCASATDPSITNQRIAIYGLPSGTRTQQANLVRSATAWDTPTKFVSPSGAFAVGGGAATAVISGDDNPKSASLTLHTYQGSTAGSASVPPGARVESAVAELHYGVVSSPKPVTFTIGWQGGSLSTTCSASGSPATCDLTSLLQSAPYAYRNLNSSRLTVTASAPDLAATVPPTCNKAGNNCQGGSPAETASVTVDALVLKVTYREPGFEAHDRSAGPLLLSQTPSPITIVRGTVYAPSADLSLKIHNKEFTDFKRGIIARNLLLEAIGNNISENSAISIPGFTGTPPRIVLFTAKIGGDVKMRARVRYVDKNPAGVDAAGYAVEVLDWETVR